MVGKKFRDEHKIRAMTGFSLIELIVVIIILGILAAVAIPRFLGQSTNARVAALNGLSGAINSAVTLSQAEYRAEGNSSTSTVTTIKMDTGSGGTGGTSVTVVAGSGNPAGATGGIDTALRTYTGFTVAYSGGVGTFTFTNAPTGLSNCYLTYTASTGATAITSSGC